MSLSAGQQVGEYVLEAQVGHGAFGEVWRARHHVWADRTVAVKVPTDPAFVSSLQREGISIHGLSHPNIVRAINFDPYAVPPYLVMEYVGGPSLRQLLQKRGALPVEEAVAILRQVLQALVHAHARGVTHRDVKPENILIAEGAHPARLPVDGVKLADFGLGQRVAETSQSIVFSSTFSGKQGEAIAGTLDYMAPEQRQPGAAIDGRADLYACGVILYEMLTGMRPAGIELPSAHNPKVPARLDQAYSKSYARVDKRFTTAEEFLGFLEAPAAESVAPSPPPAAVPPPRVPQPTPAPRSASKPTQPGRRSSAVKAIVMLALIIGGVLGASKAFLWYDHYSQSYEGSWTAYHIFVKDEQGSFSGSARVVAAHDGTVLLGVKSGDMGFTALIKAKTSGASLCVSNYDLTLRFAGNETRPVKYFAASEQNTPGDDITFFLRVDAAAGAQPLTEGTHFTVHPTTRVPGTWYSADKFGVARFIADQYHVSTTVK